MKRNHSLLLLLVCLLSLSFSITSYAQGTATTNVYYGGFQACGGCTVCGADYWCINTLGSYCGDTPPCDTKTFWDPVPAGNIVTNIQLNMWIGECQGSTIDASVNSNVFPQTVDGNTGCLCSALPCGQTTSTTTTYPCGISDYNYGSSAPNTLQLCTGAGVCMQRIEIICTYAPADQSTPPTGTGTVSGNTFACAGNSETYTLTGGPFTGVATYNWTVPAGWSITSGQGTTSITVTASSSSGQVCCTPTNLCGTAGPFCLAVTGSALPLAPTATVDFSNFCAGSVSTINLTALGGSGTTLNWYSGSCGSSVIGTGVNLTLPAPAVTTTYYCAWTASCGTSTCGSVTVTVNPLPAADAGTSPGTITCSTTQLTLAASGGTSYSWSASGGGNIVSGANSANPVVNAGGTYTVTVTDGNGCTATDNVVVPQSTTPPVASAGNDISMCTGNSIGLNASGGTSYAWSPAAGLSATNVSNPIATPGSTTTYVVTVTDANGCTASDDIIVTVSSTPAASAGSDVSICLGSSTNLSASGGNSYSWSPSATLDNPNIPNPVATPVTLTTYVVTVTSAGGCTATDDVIVDVLASPAASAGADVSMCSGSTVPLNASGGGSYAWSPSTGLSATDISNPIAFPAITTTYTLTVTNGNGCSATDDIIVTVKPTPVADAGPDVSICDWSSATLIASGGTTYLWSNGATTATTVVSPHTPTTYTVTVTSVGGCSDSDDILVSISPYTPGYVWADGPMGFCSGSTDPVTLNAAAGYISYLWSTGATTQSITVTTVGTYWVIETSSNGCGDTVFVQVQNFPAAIAPVIIADGPTDFCEGEQISVNLTTVDEYDDYIWTSGSITPIIHVTHSGWYSVTVTDSNGCTAASQNQIHVQFIPKPVAYLNYSASGLFVNFYDYSLNGDTYFWDFGDGGTDTAQNPGHTYAASGVYDVMLIVTNMCGSDTAYVTIRIYSGAGFDDFEYIENFFVYPVPANGTLNISFDYAGLDALELKMYNTLGQVVNDDKVIDLSGKYDETLDVHSFVPGIYFLQINTDKGSVNWKIIKE